jgi:3-dehydroquinate synthase
MQTIPIRTPSGPYSVVCGHGALARVGALIARLKSSSGVFVLSSPRIWKLWGPSLSASLPGWHGSRMILFDDAEPAKKLSTVENICRQLVATGADRNCVLVALGGGVVGDVAGFVAASYLRGVRLVHVPTTLVAQVDSAIGGKTGVNLPEGKNLIGAFYQPALVVADPRSLSTLPDRQYRSGLYEVIKYGVIDDPSLFRFLENRIDALARKDASALAWVIPRCIRAKEKIVSHDERESGLRQVLNFGHTLGHTLETATRYRRFLHGEAVGWGMFAATLASAGLGRLPVGDAKRIAALIARLGPLPPLRGIPAEKVLRIMRADKKSRSGHVRWVVPRRIGRVEWGVEVPEGLVRDVWRELPRLFAMARVCS